MFSELLEIVSTADSLDDAVEEALQHFGCTRAEVEVDVLEASSRGFLGFFGRKAKVRVRLIDRAHLAAFACQQILQRTGISANVSASLGSEQFEINISGDDVPGVIGRKGQTLEALQYLTVALADRHTGDRTSIVLDCDNYRSKRRSFIKRLGRRLCSQVKRSGKPVTVQPLPPQERRIMHLALQNDEAVEVRSVGHGFERKMVISPRRG